eukprot:s147_g7.t1
MSTMKTMMMLLMLVLLFLLAEVGKAYRLQPLKEVSPQDVAEGVAAPSMGPEEVSAGRTPEPEAGGMLAALRRAASSAGRGLFRLFGPAIEEASEDPEQEAKEGM